MDRYLGQDRARNQSLEMRELKAKIKQLEESCIESDKAVVKLMAECERLEAERAKTEDNFTVYAEEADEKTEELKMENERLKRRFPMIDGPDIAWTTAEKFYEMYSYMFGTSQSLERLAERGGYYWTEVAYITKIYKKKKAR